MVDVQRLLVRVGFVTDYQNALNGDEDRVKRVRADFQHADISNKLKTLLVIAAKVQKGGKNVTAEDVANARGRARPISKSTILF